MVLLFREMQPPGFPPLVTLQLQMWKSWTAPSLCCARCKMHSRALLHSLLYWRQMLGAAQSHNSSRAGRMAGCICDTKLSVIQMLLPDPLNSAVHCGPAASLQHACDMSLVMLSPGLRARMCAMQETHHRLLPEPTAKEVYYSSLKEDEKLRGGLLMCQRPSNGKIPNQQDLVLKHQTLHLAPILLPVPRAEKHHRSGAFCRCDFKSSPCTAKGSIGCG